MKYFLFERKKTSGRGSQKGFFYSIDPTIVVESCPKLKKKTETVFENKNKISREFYSDLTLEFFIQQGWRCIQIALPRRRQFHSITLMVFFCYQKNGTTFKVKMSHAF